VAVRREGGGAGAGERMGLPRGEVPARMAGDAPRDEARAEATMASAMAFVMEVTGVDFWAWTARLRDAGEGGRDRKLGGMGIGLVVVLLDPASGDGRTSDAETKESSDEVSLSFSVSCMGKLVSILRVLLVVLLAGGGMGADFACCSFWAFISGLGGLTTGLSSVCFGFALVSVDWLPASAGFGFGLGGLRAGLGSTTLPLELEEYSSVVDRTGLMF